MINWLKVETAEVPGARIVAARQATSFHPELTDDTRFHEYFLSLAP